ncbi:MAG TPA: metalloregulator ArsR/SmtB family transcription factor [Acidobacteriota bacterium]|jgi:ArsR family transcriptional regulator|nr:metalloregulator ArsR/SmtB family transcription factor [Acidobacteriota bacterium]HRR26108.1 metalloregulator ArsR/SmtB family transcription factor [Acidobacteriota bacterium]HRV08874.1 metalloregulator ArsR/SmtB family transcription factor [Acidobacteriota bacterium]
MKKLLTDEALELVANRFKVLADPLRLKLVQLLMDGPEDVSSLVHLSGANQANVSRHLSTLARAGILNRRKVGLHVYYEIADDSVLELCELVCGSIEKYHASQAEVLRS